MKRIFYASAIVAVCLCGTSVPCFAQGGLSVSNLGTSDIMSISALFISVLALIIALRARLVSRKAMINATEDFQLMIESTKNTINKSIRGLRREMQRSSQNANGNGEQSAPEAKPARSQQHHRRPYRHPQQKPNGEAQQSGTEQQQPDASEQK